MYVIDYMCNYAVAAMPASISVFSIVQYKHRPMYAFLWDLELNVIDSTQGSENDGRYISHSNSKSINSRNRTGLYSKDSHGWNI